MSKIKLYDKVRIKSKNIIGFVVDVLNDKEKFIVEKVCKLWYNNKGIQFKSGKTALQKAFFGFKSRYSAGCSNAPYFHF